MATHLEAERQLEEERERQQQEEFGSRMYDGGEAEEAREPVRRSTPRPRTSTPTRLGEATTGEADLEVIEVDISSEEDPDHDSAPLAWDEDETGMDSSLPPSLAASILSPPPPSPTPSVEEEERFASFPSLQQPSPSSAPPPIPMPPRPAGPAVSIETFLLLRPLIRFGSVPHGYVPGPGDQQTIRQFPEIGAVLLPLELPVAVPPHHATRVLRDVNPSPFFLFLPNARLLELHGTRVRRRAIRADTQIMVLVTDVIRDYYGTQAPILIATLADYAAQGASGQAWRYLLYRRIMVPVMYFVISHTCPMTRVHLRALFAQFGFLKRRALPEERRLLDFAFGLAIRNPAMDAVVPRAEDRWTWPPLTGFMTEPVALRYTPAGASCETAWSRDYASPWNHWWGVGEQRKHRTVVGSWRSAWSELWISRWMTWKGE